MFKKAYSNLPVSFRYVVLFAIGLSIILVLQTYTSSIQNDVSRPNMLNKAIFILATYLLWALIAPVLYYFVSLDGVSPIKFLKPAQLKFLASIPISFVHMVLSNLFCYTIIEVFLSNDETSDSLASFIEYMPEIFLSRFIDYWIFFGIFTGLHYYKKFNEKQVQLADLKNELTKAQLNSLRMQLNPHFLFNALNTISSLMDIDVTTAQRMMTKVSYLLRTMLEDVEGQFVMLKDEILFIRTYLDIEQERFNDRLKVEYNLDPETLEAEIPNLILQPLVENAVKHGFSKQPGICTIKISSEIDARNLTIIVNDDGKGVKEINEVENNSGIGVKNTKERLAKIYGDRFDLKITSYPDNGFTVRIKIPLKYKNKWIVDAD